MKRPRTQTVLEALRQRIAHGEQVLPAERTLAAAFRVSRTTIRSALAVLAEERVLIRQQGRGTAVMRGVGSLAVIHLVHPVFNDIVAGDTYLAALVESVACKAGSAGQALALHRLPTGERLMPAVSGQGQAGLRGGGVIVVGDPGDHDGLLGLQDARVPVVVVGDPLARIPAPVIGGDHAAMIRSAWSLLEGLGHQAIALVDGPAGDAYVCHRRAAYRALAASAGRLPIEIPTIGWDAEAGSAAAVELLRHPARPTALIAYGDYATVGMMTSLRSRGVVVPRDLSVVVIDHRVWIDRVLGQAMTGWYESPDLVAETALAALAAQREGVVPRSGPGSVPFSCRPGASTGPIRPESC